MLGTNFSPIETPNYGVNVMTIDMSNVTLKKTASEGQYEKYNKLDDNGIRNLIEMAKNDVMKADYKKIAAFTIAKERDLSDGELIITE